MSAIWTLLAGGVEKTLADWGITSKATVTFRSTESDEFAFDVRPTDALAPPDFDLDDEIVLKKDGVTWFTGYIRQNPSSGSARTERNSYVAKNFWDQMERIVYQQSRSLINVGWVGTTQYALTDIIFFQDPLYDPGVFVKINAGTQVDKILAYAEAKGAGFAASRGFSGPTPPSEHARDITCAAALRRVLSWSPDVVTWADYSTSPPTLYLHSRLYLTPVVIDLTDGSVSEFSIRPRADLVPAGVVFHLLYSEINPADGLYYTRVVTQSAGSTSGIGVIVSTIDLPFTQDGAYEPVPTGPVDSGQTFAEYFYAALSAVFFEGTIRFKAEDCPGTIRPSKRLSFSGVTRPGWDTADAIVQAVTENLMTGETEVTLGPMSRLSAQDVVALGGNRPILGIKQPPVPPPSPPDSGGKDTRPGNKGQCYAIELCSGQTITVGLCNVVGS